jgi:hypothetical protein
VRLDAGPVPSPKQKPGVIGRDEPTKSTEHCGSQTKVLLEAEDAAQCAAAARNATLGNARR